MTVLEAVKFSGTSAFFVKGSIAAAQKMLSPGETVFHALTANISTRPVLGKLSHNAVPPEHKLAGVVVVTSRRIFFCNNVMGQGLTKQIALSQIQSQDDCFSLMGIGCLRVTGTTDMLVITGSRDQLSALQDGIARAQLAASASSVSSGGSEDSSVADRLRSLRGLLEEGILTEEEYQRKRAVLVEKL